MNLNLLHLRYAKAPYRRVEKSFRKGVKMIPLQVLNDVLTLSERFSLHTYY